MRKRTAGLILATSTIVGAYTGEAVLDFFASYTAGDLRECAMDIGSVGCSKVISENVQPELVEKKRKFS